MLGHISTIHFHLEKFSDILKPEGIDLKGHLSWPVLKDVRREVVCSKNHFNM